MAPAVRVILIVGRVARLISKNVLAAENQPIGGQESLGEGTTGYLPKEGAVSLGLIADRDALL